jgi:hypothetical protein
MAIVHTIFVVDTVLLTTGDTDLHLEPLLCSRSAYMSLVCIEDDELMGAARSRYFLVVAMSVEFDQQWFVWPN